MSGPGGRSGGRSGGKPAGGGPRGGNGRKGGPRPGSRSGTGQSASRGAAAETPPAPKPLNARRVAIDALNAVDEGAYANLVLPQLLTRARREGLADRDISLVTELVYGTVRMRRQLDSLLAPYLSREPDAQIRGVLRMGAYQINHMRIPAHAAVGETVEIAPMRGRGFVNAVLRKVAGARVEPAYATVGEELSYPDWIVRTLTDVLGDAEAREALTAMNVAATVHTRDDGYIQDLASQAVAAYVGARPGERILDLCAAPGGKATAMAGAGAFVVAADLHTHRVGLVAENAASLQLRDRIGIVQCDARRLPLRPGSFDRVLVDAPCSGLGSLRRRPDARWRIAKGDVADLAVLQRELVREAVGAVRSGGTLVFSACTMTREETLGIDEFVASEFPALVALDPPSGPGWRAWGRGGLLVPGAADAMFAVAYRVP